MCDHHKEERFWVILELLRQLAVCQTGVLTSWWLFLLQKQKGFASLKPSWNFICFLLANDYGTVFEACDCSTPPQRHPCSGQDREIPIYRRAWAPAGLPLHRYLSAGSAKCCQFGIAPTLGSPCCASRNVSSRDKPTYLSWYKASKS